MAWKPELLKRLIDNEIPFVIIGGIAAIAHGSARVTEDIDICAPLDHENAARIIRALADAHPKFRMRPDMPEVKEDNSNLYGLKNLYLRTDLGQIDILGDLPGIGTFDELDGKSIEVAILGMRCPVLDLETLIAAKSFAGREKDKLAIRELEVIREMRRKGNSGK